MKVRDDWEATSVVFISVSLLNIASEKFPLLHSFFAQPLLNSSIVVPQKKHFLNFILLYYFCFFGPHPGVLSAY